MAASFMMFMVVIVMTCCAIHLTEAAPVITASPGVCLCVYVYTCVLVGVHVQVCPIRMCMCKYILYVCACGVHMC